VVGDGKCERPALRVPDKERRHLTPISGVRQGLACRSLAGTTPRFDVGRIHGSSSSRLLFNGWMSSRTGRSRRQK